MEMSEYKDRLMELWGRCEDLPKDYWPLVNHWFEDIAFLKAEEYGNEAWERLGPRAFVVNTSAVYYRWKRLHAKGYRRKDDVMLNALVDAFGFSMIFHVCLGVNIPVPFTPATFQTKAPDELDDYLIDLVWHDGRFETATGLSAAHITLTQAFEMWRLTPE